jgi:putative ABC transport system permease protein
MSRRDDREHDLDDEIRHHLRMASEDRGDEAARREFGNLTLIKEVTREMWGFASFDRLVQDLRYALRAFRRSPGFAAVAILSLALGIGANTAIFSLIDAVLLKMLPVSHPEQLLQVVLDGDQESFSNPIWEQVRDRQDVFSAILARGNWQFNLATGGEQRRVPGEFASGDYFETLGVSTILGRTFTRDDDRRGCAGAAVLAYDFWQREYGADPSVITRTILLDNHMFPIIGVLAPGFHGTTAGTAKGVFLPLCSEAIIRGEASALDQRTNWWLYVIGRPRPGVSPAQVTARLKTLAPSIFENTVPKEWGPDGRAGYLRRSFETNSAATGLSYLRQDYRPALWTLMAVVALVLLIACANVANLLLARSTARQKEIAVRLALGAGRARILRQLLTESLFLSMAAAMLGAIFARWGAALIIHMISVGGNPVFLDLTLDPRVLAFTIGVAVLTGLLFGIAPAWRATRVSPQGAMKENSRTATQSRASFSAGNTLVMAQVALSLVLVAGAGLLVGTFRNLETLDPGFSRDHVLLMTVDLRNTTYPKERRAAVYRDITDHLRALPGVDSASTSSLLPVSRSSWTNDIRAEGGTQVSPENSSVFFNQISSGYFETMGTALLAGRDFNDHDTPNSPPVAIVSEALARKFFGVPNAVGRTYRKVSDQIQPAVEIVGVVRDAKYRDLRDAGVPTIYQPVSQDSDLFTFSNFEVRAEASAEDLIPTVKSAMAQFNPNVVLTFKTMTTHIDQSLARERLLATLSGFFGALALLLSAIGLYGVMSYSVARRRNEIGIRMALGAEQRRILGMVLRDVAVLVTVGLAAGIGAALLATRMVASFLYGVTARDPGVIAISSAVLAIVAAAAGYLPARRASRLDPMTALREE